MFSLNKKKKIGLEKI